MSGTIPSMETSSEPLKNNTVIVGASCLPSSLPAYNLQSSVPPEILQRKRSVSVLSLARAPLTFSKTFPALFALYRQALLPRDVKIVGYARTQMSPDEYLKRITSYIKIADNEAGLKAKLEEFKALSSYVSGAYDDGASFDALNKYISEIEARYQTKETNRLFYLALPPSVFIPVAQNLKEHCYVFHGINRIIVEKPFGKDFDSSRHLVAALRQGWKEEETFRIDHYLGKEMVKNILVLRFANIALNAAWDRNSISNVQISFKEPFGTEGRGGYFDEFGIIRDILQNREFFSPAITRSKRALNRAFASRPAAGVVRSDHGTPCVLLGRGYTGRKGNERSSDHQWRAVRNTY